jgi:hypothetical protein
MFNSVAPNVGRLGSLPAELRLAVFAHSGLVARDRNNGRKSGVHIYDGEYHDPPYHSIYMHEKHDCHCPSFPTELLSLDMPFCPEIHEVLYSNNRIILGGFPAKSLAFLRAHSWGLRRIRELDLHLDPDEVEKWTEKGSPLPAEWKELIAFIRQNLDLPRLTLSLDTGMAVPIYEENRMGEEDADFILETYKMILEPLHGLAESGLKRFYVYWACRNSHEAEAEKEIMGEDYEASDKVPFSRRHPLFPHWDTQEDPGQKEKPEV